MTDIAELAEELNHHPEWCNVYSRLTIRLTTHDVGGLSELDFTMAERIDQLIKERRHQTRHCRNRLPVLVAIVAVHPIPAVIWTSTTTSTTSTESRQTSI